MSRSYKNVRPKKHYVYSVPDLMALYGVERNTVTNWVKEGLRRSDNGVPYIFNGAEVKRFHKSRRQVSNVKLRIGQFKCLGCKGRVFPEPRSLSPCRPKNGSFSYSGACPDCGAVVLKRVNETDCDKILHCINTNTSLASLDEGREQAPVDIGNDRCLDFRISHKVNDRILYDWLQFAGRWDQKTILAKLATIRGFEKFCDGKAFSKLIKDDVTGFRDGLKASVETSTGAPASISTVRHRASHLKSFLEWLIEQKGYQGLNKSLPSYLALPKKFDAGGLAARDRHVLSVSEAVQMVDGMPFQTVMERRDRAMVAIAFLAALRADTVTSLRVKHLQRSTRTVVQDARSSRTKNGKSLRIKFFPLPEIFSKLVCDWKDEMVDLGFSDEDALFPDRRYLTNFGHTTKERPIPAMTSTHAISRAFKAASKPLGIQLSPHAAKYCIGNLSFQVCKSPEEFKAWSLNMGHEAEEVTVRYYRHLPENRVSEIFELFDQADDKESELSMADKDLMLRYHEHKLDRGTADFARARQLVIARQAE